MNVGLHPNKANSKESKTLPAHFRVFEGDLFDDRKTGFFPLRKRYQYTFARMKNLSQVKATLRGGRYTWPGSYPLFLVTRDGAALCFECAIKEFRQIAWDYLHHASTGWRVEGCEVNYEDPNLFCDHCSEPIESAYGPCPECLRCHGPHYTGPCEH